MSASKEIGAISEILPSDFNYEIRSEKIIRKPWIHMAFEAELEVDFKTMEDAKNWVSEFSLKSQTNWVIFDSHYWKMKKYPHAFSITYLCHHSSYRKKDNSQ